MRTNKCILTFIMLAAVIFFTTQPAHAGCATMGGVAPITVYKDAAGTKVSGPLTVCFIESDPEVLEVLYPDLCPDTTEEDTCPESDMYFFLRLRKGNKLYFFSGYSQGVDFDNFTKQQIVLTDFFNTKVLEVLYPDLDPDDYPPALLKSYDQDVVSFEDPSENGYTYIFTELDKPKSDSYLDFYIMDIVVAIQD